MNKLHSITFYALITPIITLGAGSLLAQAPAAQDPERQQPSTQGQAAQRTPGQPAQHEQGAVTAGQPGSQSAADRLNTNDGAHKPSRGFISAVPANGIHASKLIGAEVKTSSDENLGSVSELIIDESGQIVAIVVGVGGFLGMGERDVAIGWDDVTKSGSGDDQELEVSLTRESLSAAPAFKAGE